MLTPERLSQYLSITDLSAQEDHVMNMLLVQIQQELEQWTGLPATISRSSPVVEVKDNYDRLNYSGDAAARSARHSHYLGDGKMLRTHTSAMIPPLLTNCEDDALWICPGLVYRRDVVDRSHVGEPHQVDLWTVRRGRQGRDDMLRMIDVVLSAALPGLQYRTNETYHPYTVNGLEVEVNIGDRWVEILECGQVNPWILEDTGLCAGEWSGLAMGIGLDRLVMLRKGISDIRLLRAKDNRISDQMRDLSPYRPVSARQATRRDLSVCVSDPDEELMGDRIRQALGSDAELIEDTEVLLRAKWDEVPPAARERLDMAEHHTNVLVRVTLRAIDRDITRSEGNEIYTRIYQELHEGNVGYAI